MSTGRIHLRPLGTSICIVLGGGTKRNGDGVTGITFGANKFLERRVKSENLRPYTGPSASPFPESSADFEEAGATSLAATTWGSARETLGPAVLDKVPVSVEGTSDKGALAGVFSLEASDRERGTEALAAVAVFETA